MPKAIKKVSAKPARAKSRRASSLAKPEEPQEFPISHAMLRRMYDSMIESRLWSQSQQLKPRVSEATAVPAALAVKANDTFFAPADGCTLYPVIHEETVVAAYEPENIRKGLMQVRRKHSHAMALAIVSESDFSSSETTTLVIDALRDRLPIVFLVLSDQRFDPESHVIEIDVDGHDAVAVYRVVSESIRRARNGRGPAVIHAHGATTPLSGKSQHQPLERFQAYLNARGLSTDDIHVLHRE